MSEETPICEWCNKPRILMPHKDAGGVVHQVCQNCWEDHLVALGKVYEAMRGVRTEARNDD